MDRLAAALTQRVHGGVKESAKAGRRGQFALINGFGEAAEDAGRRTSLVGLGARARHSWRIRAGGVVNVIRSARRHGALALPSSLRYGRRLARQGRRHYSSEALA
jgi:hypothetical protein